MPPYVLNFTSNSPSLLLLFSPMPPSNFLTPPPGNYCKVSYIFFDSAYDSVAYDLVQLDCQSRQQNRRNKPIRIFTVTERFSRVLIGRELWSIREQTME